MASAAPPAELRQQALGALLETDPVQKVLMTQQAMAQAGTLAIEAGRELQAPAGLPGCPERPELRSHLDVPKRSPFTREGLAALLHAVTHIEFNAIKTV
jgi:uncharacterized ferritin-like protein (DUF455 family)